GKLLRDEERRARHEKEAAVAQLTDCSAEEGIASRTELTPLVFEALDVLSRKHRDAILMRFIENRSFAEVAVAMGTSEAAAKMRTGRALEKLRDLLEKRGASLTLATLSAGLAGAASAAPSAVLAASVSAAALGAKDSPFPKGSLRRISRLLPDTLGSRSGCRILNITVPSISVRKTVRRIRSTEREVCSTSRCRSMDGNACDARRGVRTKTLRPFPLRTRAHGSTFGSKSVARRCGH